MVGNDVVDLKFVVKNPKSTNSRFLQKICCEEEIEAVLSSKDPELTLWRIWSMKESGYKIIVKKTGLNLYIPKRIQTNILDDRNGKVQSEWGEFSCFTEYGISYIHSVAFDDGDNIHCQVTKNTGVDASDSVRKSLIERLNILFPDSFGKEDLSFKKKGNIPLLFSENKPLDLDISLSHHEDWIAWAFMDK